MAKPPDYYDQWRQHDAIQQEKLSKRPLCGDCGEHVQEDHYYLIFGETVCPDCLKENYRKDIEDYAY